MEGFSHGFQLHLESCQEHGAKCCGSLCGVAAHVNVPRGDMNRSCNATGVPLAACAPGMAFLPFPLIEKLQNCCQWWHPAIASHLLVAIIPVWVLS